MVIRGSEFIFNYSDSFGINYWLRSAD